MWYGYVFAICCAPHKFIMKMRYELKTRNTKHSHSIDYLPAKYAYKCLLCKNVI